MTITCLFDHSPPPPPPGPPRSPNFLADISVQELVSSARSPQEVWWVVGGLNLCSSATRRSRIVEE
ncbi:uncharacterized protein CELE_T06D10.8 [Caenorhabditis elegans]|uniref:Uncharacterized protein n=1 Tax=Caenorhabditis elegans TaxID=6239 RepID=A0A2K5ATP3_CAEEL|nr:Uncharacterized protein CELE_T06D10.8 [Caenorhabditis elegans]SPC47135.2 Uncharacterized protein CELE_T06D10.8 [Caenorhabditis elegans]|eukprot:NP_001348683.2 Uncharacterized protein CELE_T06D10.8 [Caenorhabditis elegans]